MLLDSLYGKLRHAAALGLLLAGMPLSLAWPQDTFELRAAEPLNLPLVIDSNGVMFWQRGRLYLYTSTGTPLLTVLGKDARTVEVNLDSTVHLPMWIESIWQGRGTIYGWYHHERLGLCPGTTLTTPEIGAIVSYDGGRSFHDLGIVLSSGEPNDCSAQNGYFSNGHGDFSVIRDREGHYFYFLFGAYGGDVSRQGIALARMAANDLAAPVGKIWKYHAGGWLEPGLAGRVTPVFPARVPWQSAEADSFWGPSIHWNMYLEKYVVLMNRSCCRPGWPQEGVYLTMSVDLADPASWSEPVKILETGDWYPWALGVGPWGSSTMAGQVARLFVRNLSEWEIVFQRAADPEATSQSYRYKSSPPHEPQASSSGTRRSNPETGVRRSAPGGASR